MRRRQALVLVLFQLAAPSRGDAPFLLGANYVPSHDWHTTLENWDAAAVDADLAALSRIGVKCLRVFPLWPLLQPKPDAVDATRLDRLASLLDLAHRHGLVVQVSPLTGWMSGLTFLPPWADGNVFVDNRIVAGEERLVRAVASRLRGHPALHSWDFGNEVNVLVDVMRLEVTPAQAEAWMQRIYRAFKEADPATPVTNGIGTGFDPRFNTRAIARSSDFLSVHSYPQFHRTNLLDPPFGMRTTYSVNLITAWAMAEGKPVLMQETGASEDQATPLDVARYLRLTLASAWAEGAAGYFWWCTHDIRPGYQARVDGFFPKYSLKGQQDGRLSAMEQSLGLFTFDNRVLSRQPVEVGAWRFGEPLFVRTRVGKGRFFFLGADLEGGLLARYDPWREDESHLFYAALLPAADVDIDNPAVELAHKARGGEELLVLANHSESWQDVVVSSRRALLLEDAEGGVALGQGRSIPLRLAPAQVVFARVSRPPDGRPGAPSLR